MQRVASDRAPVTPSSGYPNDTAARSISSNGSYVSRVETESPPMSNAARVSTRSGRENARSSAVRIVSTVSSEQSPAVTNGSPGAGSVYANTTSPDSDDGRWRESSAHVTQSTAQTSARRLRTAMMLAG